MVLPVEFATLNLHAHCVRTARGDGQAEDLQGYMNVKIRGSSSAVQVSQQQLQGPNLSISTFMFIFLLPFLSRPGSECCGCFLSFAQHLQASLTQDDHNNLLPPAEREEAAGH